MKSIILLIILFFLILACTDEKIVTVEVMKENSWQEEKGFRDIKKVTLSTGCYENTLYFQHPKHHTEIENGKISQFAWLDMPNSIDFALPFYQGLVTSPVYLIHNDPTLIVSNLKASYSRDGYLRVNLLEIDSLFRKVLNPILGKWMAINDKKQILFQYEQNIVKNKTLMLLDISTAYNDNAPYNAPHEISLLKSKTITIDSFFLGWPDPYYIRSFDDYFFIQWAHSNFYKIYSDGSYKRIPNVQNTYSLFKYKGNLYAYSYFELYISRDQGETWRLFAELNDFSKQIEFYNINDSLVYSHRDALYTVNFESNFINSRELKNDGLEDRFITGIEVLNDTVYIATYSGVFKKSIYKFFESKINN
ncbi:MAG: hypothetical protein GX121_07770 [Ignavibacteria bacterium]|nr:hypothetical protein [Ignavibacteria bacterium]